MIDKFERDANENAARDWEYIQVMKAFYTLYCMRNQNGADIDMLDLIIAATQSGIKEELSWVTYVTDADIERAREVAEKHAEYKRYKGMFNDEPGYEGKAVTFSCCTIAHTLQMMYGGRKFVSRYYSDGLNGYGEQVPFVDRKHWIGEKL